jgi:5-methylcytosine-specific restriction endonuclease McrA
MDINHKAQLLAFFGAAGARLSREQKRDKIVRPNLLRLGREVFGQTAETTGELAAKIEALGKIERRRLCRAYAESQGSSDAKPASVISASKFRKLRIEAKKKGRLQRDAVRLADRIQTASVPIALSQPDEAIRQFYASWEWKRLSYDVKLERSRKCECCGAKAPEVRIHTDHIKPIRKHWHLRLDRSNLQILCEDCNMGKGSRDETDFRVPA